MLKIMGQNIKYAKGNVIFKNLNLSFPNKGMFGFIGESGSGKTSFFRAILGQMENIKIIYNGEEIVPEKQNDFVMQNVFFVDQFGTYFENMTIKQHFEFYGSMINKKVNDSIVQYWLSIVGLNNVNVNNSPEKLSLGERKRFLISLAFFSEKCILLLDEPTASLDQDNIYKLKKLFLENKKLILISSHDDTIFEICDKVYKIENKELDLILENNNEDDKERIYSKKYSFYPLKYIKYKNFYQLLKSVLIILLGLFVCFQTSVGINNIFVLYNDYKQSDYILNENIIYFRNRFGNNDSIYTGSDITNSKPLLDNSKKEILQIDGVKNIIPFFNLYNDDGIDDFENLYVYRNDILVNTFNDSSDGRPICVMPHLKDNKKIYISESLSMYGKIKIKDKIQLNIYVPCSQYIYDDDDESSYRFISYDKVSISLKIDEIANKRDMYHNTTASDIIYIPYDMYNSLITKVNGKIGLDKPRDTELKREDFQFNNYVIICENDKIQDVYLKLLELDSSYDVFSNQLFYIEQSEMFFNTLIKEIAITLGVSIISIVAFITIFYYHMFSHKNEIQLLINNGISNKYINNIWKYEAIIHCFIWLIICGILSLLKNQILIFLISMILIILLYIIENLIINYINKKIQY